MTDLIPRFYVGDLELTDYPFSVLFDDVEVDLGSPQNVMDLIAVVGGDGEAVSSTRTSNREGMVVPLLIEGADLAELADNEATLIQACEKVRNTFTVDPGDDYGPPTVFDTFRIQAKHQRSSAHEAALIRRWDLMIPALPYARSATPITQTLEPTTTPTFTVLDGCTSASAWSGSSWYYPATITQQTYLGESVIRATHAFAGFNVDHRALVTWIGSSGTDPYVFLDICWDGDGAPLYRRVELAVAGGGFQPPVATELVTHGTGSYVRYWFENIPSATSLAFLVARDWPNYSLPSDPVPLRIAQLASSTAASGGTIQVVDTVGSVRSPGSITVTRAGDPMDYLFIYSDPAMLNTGYSPAVEDSWALAPAGTYVIYASGLGAAGDVVAVTVTDGAGRESTATTRLPTDPPMFRPIGEVRLGGARDGRLGALTFDATIDGSPTVLTMANVRLFRKDDDTALTYVDDIAAETVELATPSVDLPRGGLWADDWAAFDKAVCWAFPSIVCPQTALYVEVDGSAPPATSLSYYPRFHTYSAYQPDPS